MSKFLIVGLGNPGRKYEKTRHNAGFMALDFLVKDIFGKKTKWQVGKKVKASFLKENLDGSDVEIIKPETYMNSSGSAVAAVVKKHNLKPENIIVVYDELDLPLGDLRIRQEGSSAGHNGIKSIIESLGSDRFWRVRIGISNDKRDKMPADKFVLSKFDRSERKQLEKEVLPEVVDEIKKIIF